MPDGRLANVAVTASNTWTQIYTVPAGKTAVANINIVNTAALGATSASRISIIATSGSYSGVTIPTAASSASNVGFSLVEQFDINFGLETLVMTNMSGSSLGAVTQSYTLAQYDYIGASSTTAGAQTAAARDIREITVPGSASFTPYMPVAPISTSRKEHVAIGERGMVFNTVYPRLSQSLARDYWYWQFQEPISQPLPANISGSYRRIKYINGIHFILTNSGSYAVRDSDWQSFTLARGDFLDVDYNPTSSTYAFVGVSASLSTVFTSSVGTSSLTTPAFSQPSASGVFYTIDWVPPALNAWYIGSTHGVLSSSNLTTWGSASISGAGVIVPSVSGTFLMTYLPTRDINLYAPANSASANSISVFSGSTWITSQPSGANARITDVVEFNNTYTVMAGTTAYFIFPQNPAGQQTYVGPSFNTIKGSLLVDAGNITLTKMGISASTSVSQSITLRLGGSTITNDSFANVYYGLVPPYFTSGALSSSNSSPYNLYPGLPFAYSSSLSGSNSQYTSPGTKNATYSGQAAIHEGIIVATSMPRVRKVHGLIRGGSSVLAIGRQNKMFAVDTADTVTRHIPVSVHGNRASGLDFHRDDYYLTSSQDGVTVPQVLFYMDRGPTGSQGSGLVPQYWSLGGLNTRYVSTRPGLATGSLTGPHSIDEHTHIIRYVQLPHHLYHASSIASSSGYVSVVVVPKVAYSSSNFISSTNTSSITLTSSVLTNSERWSGQVNSAYPIGPVCIGRGQPSGSAAQYMLHSATTASGTSLESVFDYPPFIFDSPWWDGGIAKFNIFKTGSSYDPATGGPGYDGSGISLLQYAGKNSFVSYQSGSVYMGYYWPKYDWTRESRLAVFAEPTNGVSYVATNNTSLVGFKVVNRVGMTANTPYNIIPFLMYTPLTAQGVNGDAVRAEATGSGLLPLMISTNLSGSAQVRLLRQNAQLDSNGVPLASSSIVYEIFDDVWRKTASGSDVTGNLIVSGGSTQPINFLYSRTNTNVLGIRGNIDSTTFYNNNSNSVGAASQLGMSASVIGTGGILGGGARYVQGNTGLRGIARGFYDVSGSTGIVLFAESGSGRVSLSVDTGSSWTIYNTNLPSEVWNFIKLQDNTYRVFDINMSASYTTDFRSYTLVTQSIDPTIYGTFEKWNMVQGQPYITSNNGKVYRVVPSGLINAAVTQSGPPLSEYLEFSVNLSNSGSILSRKGEVLGAGISLQISASAPVSVNISGFEKSN